MTIKVAHIATIDLSLRYLLLNQLCSIRDAGYEVVGVSTPGPDVPAIESAGIRHVAISMTRNFTPTADLKSLVGLARTMRSERFDIVHTHNPKPGLLGQLAARMVGVPIVVNTLHGFYFHDNMRPLWRKFYVLTEKIAARCSDVILSQNREDIQTALAEGICRPGQIKWLGNGIDIRRFHRARIDPNLLVEKRSELGLAPGVPVVGFVGRLVAEKGILELLAAAALVLQRVPCARFLMVGPSDTQKPDALTPRIAEKYGIADACVFAGMRQDMPYLYAMMDVFVLPSHREGFPRSPMEASAMEVPSIATDIRGCREAVSDGRNGRLVPLGNIDALARSITEMVMDRGLARRMGQAGRAMACERFDEQLVFARVKDEYARLAEQRHLSL